MMMHQYDSLESASKCFSPAWTNVWLWLPHFGPGVNCQVLLPSTEAVPWTFLCQRIPQKCCEIRPQSTSFLADADGK